MAEGYRTVGFRHVGVQVFAAAAANAVDKFLKMKLLNSFSAHVLAPRRATGSYRAGRELAAGEPPDHRTRWRPSSGASGC